MVVVISVLELDNNAWSTFENDIDYVVPLTTGAVDNLDLNTIPLGLSDIFVLDELT